MRIRCDICACEGEWLCTGWWEERPVTQVPGGFPFELPRQIRVCVICSQDCARRFIDAGALHVTCIEGGEKLAEAYLGGAGVKAWRFIAEGLAPELARAVIAGCDRIAWQIQCELRDDAAWRRSKRYLLAQFHKDRAAKAYPTSPGSWWRAA